MSKKTRRKQDDIPEPTPKIPDKVTLGYATLFSVFVAGSLLLLFILPAEYGFDPTGIGGAMGLTALSRGGAELDLGDRLGAVSKIEPAAPRNDTITINLAGLADNEYKLHLEGNQSMLYSWTSTAIVNFDFHGDPDKPSRPGEFSSYEASQGTSRSGSFQAPFSGRHGWYVQNVGNEPVTITLQTWGYYDVVGFLG
ncbi:MAG: hypothetical protein WC876_03540 [Candidatus Thermoplasmatota archaeon]|jgi:hypothetical protein